MATQPIPVEDFDQMLQARIREELQKVPGQTQPPPQAQKAPIKVNLDGQEFSFEDEKALSESLSRVFGEFRTAIAAKETPQPTPNQGRQVTGNEEPTFDFKQYVEKINADPLEATKYALDAAIGIKNSTDVLRAAIQTVAMQSQQLAVQQFTTAHPEFKGGRDAEVVNNYRQRFNLPFDAAGLEAAYALARQYGDIKPEAQTQTTPVTQQTQQPPVQTQGYPPPYAPNPYQPVQAPPVVHQGAPGYAVDADIDSLSTDAITKMIQQAYAQGARP